MQVRFSNRRTLLGTAAAVLIAPAVFAQAPAPILIVHANVVDGVSAQPVLGASVLLRDGKIDSVTPGKADAPAGVTVIDLQGRWLLPGFVDGHGHIADLPAARKAVLTGATTVRSMGVALFVDVGMRDLNHAGAAQVPDVIAAGYHVRPNLDENFAISFPELGDVARSLRGTENVRRVVHALASRGVNVIKILATERAGLPETDPRRRVFTDEELVAIVDEAQRAGLPVAAHAHGDEGAAAAVRAGVSTIEHGTYLSEATLALMMQRGTCLDPTIATVADLVEPGGDYDDALLSVRGRHMLPRVREAVAMAMKMGVRIIAGTDTGYRPQSNRTLAHEVAEFVALGMPPMDAIKAGTSRAAECLGVAARTGAIKPGLEADLIVVERDPLADIVNLQDVLLVINNGRAAVNRLQR